MRKIYALLMMAMLACIGCEWRLTSYGEEAEDHVIVERYDRIESLYLTTGDFSALQQMNIGYPQQTRTLIEDVLGIGRVNEPEINTKFLNFYQDTTLQALIASAEQEYANMDDINQELGTAFANLQEMLPSIQLPQVYAQIGSLDHSIIVGNGLLGISLDKYLGKDYPLSLYPMPHQRKLSQLEQDVHIGKVQWVVNQAMNKQVFNTLYTRSVGHYMKAHPKVSVDQLLKDTDYQAIR